MSSNILFIVGSLRKNSFNRQMSEAVQKILQDKANISVLEYADIPLMNQDIEFPAPKAIARVRSEVAKADGIWVFTPEYNYSYPGLLKNLFDWLSRPLVANDFDSGTAIKGKKVTISGIGGKAQTAGARAKLTELLQFIKMNVMPETFGASINAYAWQTNKLILSEETLNGLKEQAEKFIQFIK